jgi:hypothetical protein
VTEHPAAQWTAQQVVEAFPFDTAPQFLLRDGDGIYGDRVQRKLASLGINEIVTAPDGRRVWLAELDQIAEIPVVQGLHHYYLPRAA